MLARDEQLRSALKIAASALKEHGPRFALAGSFALWVFGAPEPVHDVDFVVAETDVEAAAATLARPASRSSEHRRTGCSRLTSMTWSSMSCTALTVSRWTRTVLDAAEDHDVLAITMPVLTPTVVLIQKLRSLDEHFCDFSSLLPATRAVRERVDWDRVRADTAENDFAVAFLVLADRLRITG